jgi:flagellar motor switch protein FliN/FliY
MSYPEISVEDALRTAVVAQPAVDGATLPGGPATPAATFQPLAGGSPFADVDPRRLHLLRDVEMGISVELGRTRMTVQDVLSLAPGVVLELDRAAGSPVDVLVNGTLMARGEVVVVDEEFAVRITEVVTAEADHRARA